jgi:hypothetical protein
MPPDPIPSPWAGFLDEVDAALDADVSLHCLGGFVVCARYGLTRPTADIDVLSVAPGEQLDALLRIAGKSSPLARKYRLYVDYVTVATPPHAYEQRMQKVFAGRFTHLRIFALDPYDLVLAKLERNHEVDRDDVRFLAAAVPLDVNVLRERYASELRPLLGNPGREDLTLDLWTEIIQESRG